QVLQPRHPGWLRLGRVLRSAPGPGAGGRDPALPLRRDFRAGPAGHLRGPRRHRLGPRPGDPPGPRTDRAGLLRPRLRTGVRRTQLRDRSPGFHLLQPAPAQAQPRSVNVLSRNGKPGKSQLLVSPNSVLANALLRSIDILRPRVLAARPGRIEFVV